MSGIPPGMHHVIDGPPDAPVVVLLDSLGSTLEMWQPQVPELATRFRVVRYDLPGHGGSASPPGPYTIEGLGRDVCALLDGLGIERAHLAGLSIGGMIAMSIAARVPERVDRLALFATSAELGPAERWAERAAAVLESGIDVVVDAAVGRWFTPAYAASHPDTIARMRAMYASTDPVGYAGCCRAIETMDQTADLARIIAPTLVVVGADDPAIPPEHAEVIVAGIPDARLVVLQAAAHLVTWEQPRLTTGLLMRHLSGAREPGPAGRPWDAAGDGLGAGHGGIGR